MRLRLLGSSDQCSRTPHCGDTLARAGDVLALVPQHASAAPEQVQGLRDLRPLEPTRLIPVGRTGVRGGIWVTYSDALQLVMAESPELPPNVHVGLPLRGVRERHTSNKYTLRVRIEEPCDRDMFRLASSSAISFVQRTCTLRCNCRCSLRASVPHRPLIATPRAHRCER